MINTQQWQGMDRRFARALEFIWREAELLDRKEYTAWGELWSADGFYIIPIDRDCTDYASQLNYAYDDANMRRLRIERLNSGLSMSAADAAYTVRTVSRCTLAQAEGDVVEVHSAQLLAAYKRGSMTMFAADLTHQIRLTDEGAILEQKVVRLINSFDTLNALGFLM
jgi:3-phenylpropionate/cinnamic acid dioxygenase small subunit